MIHVWDLDGTLLDTDHNIDWDNVSEVEECLVRGPIAQAKQHAEWLRINGATIYVLTARRSLAHWSITVKQIQEHLGWPPGSYHLVTMPALDFDWITYNDFKHQVLALIKTFGDVTYYGDNSADRSIAESAGVCYFDVSEL